MPTLEEMRKQLKWKPEPEPEPEGEPTLLPPSKSTTSMAQQVRARRTGSTEKSASQRRRYMQRYTVLAGVDMGNHGRLIDIKMGFGKHKGKKLSDVTKTDRGYLRWLVNERATEPEEGFAFADELRSAAEAWLAVTR